MSHRTSRIDGRRLAHVIGIGILYLMTNDGIHPGARGILESMLDAEIPVAPQYYSRGLRSACGEWGQMVRSKEQVTCPDCKKKLGR